VVATKPLPAFACRWSALALLLGLWVPTWGLAQTATGPDGLEARAAAVLALADRREFVRAQRALERLRQEADGVGDAEARARVAVMAARLLNRLPQAEAAALEASRALATSKEPALRCAAKLELLDARRQLAHAVLADADFLLGQDLCTAGHETDRNRLALVRARWLLQQQRPAEAAGLLDATRALFEPHTPAELRAVAAAYSADALQRLGRTTEARAQAAIARALAPHLSSRDPLLIASIALFRAARSEGDLHGALLALQVVREDQLAHAEELQLQQRAYLEARSDFMAQQSALALIEANNHRLTLEARAATAYREAVNRLLSLLALLLAMALLAILHIRRLRTRARRILEVDALTGLWTRAHFLGQAERVLKQAQSRGEPAALLLFDLDHFKQINDRHGHAFGDHVLVMVAAALRGLESGPRRFGRLGGEEFALLLPATRLDAALAVAEACRRAIAGIKLDAPDGSMVRPSASFGVVDTHVAGYRVRHLLANADHALYRAKAAGRNRIAATPVARPGFGPEAALASGMSIACALVLALAPAAMPAFAGALADGPVRASAHTEPSPPLVALDALEGLRQSDPAAFVAAVTARLALPPSISRGERETLALMHAHALHLQGRTAAAIASAEGLAHDAESPDLRFTARLLVVNLLIATRDFERLLRTLAPLLDDARKDRLAAEPKTRVLGLAANVYSELGRPDLAAVYARDLLALDPSPWLVCYGDTFLLAARTAGHGPAPSLADFEAALARCRESGNAYGPLLLGIVKARFLARTGNIEAALVVLEDAVGDLEAAGYRWLMAESASLRADLLLSLGRDAEAEAEARRAIGWSSELPGSRPMAVAQEVLYRLALRRGDTAAALRHLEQAMQAEDLDDAGDRAKEAALLLVRHEASQQQQALLLARKQAKQLAQAEAHATAMHRTTLLLTALLGLALMLVLGWAVRVLREERRCRQLARTDALTGFANRIGFFETAAPALRRASRAGRPAALVVFDLDHFKAINDAHGHLAGDAVLRAVAAALRELPPAERVVGRIGGEEFALLLLGATPAQARAYAEACRLAIATCEARHEGMTLRVTASFGIARADLLPESLPVLLARSDRALYRAKHAGRDRIVEHDEPGTLPSIG